MSMIKESAINGNFQRMYYSYNDLLDKFLIREQSYGMEKL